MITKVGVVGCGQMGAGIAEVCARAGCQVVVREPHDDLLKRGRDRISASLQKAVDREKLTLAEKLATLELMTFTTSLNDLADSELVIEAITEDEPTKFALFQDLDKTVNAKAVLASNTSSIPIKQLANATKRPGQVIGMHFFNPVPVMGVVEQIASEYTSGATKTICEAFVIHQLQKRLVHAPDRAGFIVNALLVPYLLSAVRFYEQGLATKEDIDDGMELGCNLPMGPLRLCDFIGLDIIKYIADVLYRELDDESAKSPDLLNQLVVEGKLGRKTGEGFYTY